MAKFLGTAPDDCVEIARNGNWVLVHRPLAMTGEWMALKLYSAERVESKANYWLAWNWVYKRFARTKDGGLLAVNRPEVYKWAIDALTAHSEAQELI